MGYFTFNILFQINGPTDFGRVGVDKIFDR